MLGVVDGLISAIVRKLCFSQITFYGIVAPFICCSAGTSILISDDLWL